MKKGIKNGRKKEITLEFDIGKIKIRRDKKEENINNKRRKKEAVDMRWWRKEDKRKQRKKEEHHRRVCQPFAEYELTAHVMLSLEIFRLLFVFISLKCLILDLLLFQCVVL
jgi:hypothetical protein